MMKSIFFVVSFQLNVLSYTRSHNATTDIKDGRSLYPCWKKESLRQYLYWTKWFFLRWPALSKPVTTLNLSLAFFHVLVISLKELSFNQVILISLNLLLGLTMLF